MPGQHPLSLDRAGWRPPVVAAQVTGRTDDGTWLLAVQCPYCPAEHHHGGGSNDQPDAGGTRAPHCQDTHYRGRLMFDARVTRFLPQYELAPADSLTDWEQEREYAGSLLEEAEMTLADLDAATARKETVSGRIVNDQIRELHGLAEEIDGRSRKGRNSAYLAAWQAKREGGGQ